MQQQREATMALWFEMWLQQQDLGIDQIFTENVIYASQTENPSFHFIRLAFLN